MAFAILVALAVVAATGAPAASAASKKSCGKEVVEDWFKNHRIIGKIYPLHCYRDAINSLSTDLKIYSGAEDDIRRALLYAQRNQSDPGPGGGPGADSVPGTGPGSSPGSGPGSGPAVNTAGPSAIPIPVVVLAGVAGLLMVLGTAGYLTRRMATRRAGDDDASDA